MTRENSTEFDGDTPQALPTVYHALRASRRRYVIQLLSKTDEDPVTVRWLSRQITALEEDIPVERATGETYRSVYNALSQSHLPTLADGALINYDPDRQTVSAGPNYQTALLLVYLTRAAYETMGGGTGGNTADFIPSINRRLSK